MNKVIIVLVILLTYFSGVCQSGGDKVNLMNGLTFEGSILDTTNGKVILQYFKKNKEKTIEFENYRVFSLSKVNEPEIIMYKQDTTVGNYLTEKEMRYYFLGEKDARKNYNPIGVKITAAVLTFGISLVDTYNKDTLSSKFTAGFFKSEPGLISIVAPFIITGLAAFPAVQISINKVSDKRYLTEQSYMDGFEKIGRSKKVFGALKFSLIGCVAGLATYYIAR